jgi:hypothetical protein
MEHPARAHSTLNVLLTIPPVAAAFLEGPTFFLLLEVLVERIRFP